AEHAEHGPACRRGGVNGSRVDVEAGASVPDDLEDLDQVPQRASQPVRGPDGDHVELATDGGLQRRIELRALVASLSATNTVILVGGDHHMAGTFRPGLELLTLRVSGIATRIGFTFEFTPQKAVTNYSTGLLQKLFHLNNGI